MAMPNEAGNGTPCSMILISEWNSIKYINYFTAENRILRTVSRFREIHGSIKD